MSDDSAGNWWWWDKNKLVDCHVSWKEIYFICVKSSAALF